MARIQLGKMLLRPSSNRLSNREVPYLRAGLLGRQEIAESLPTMFASPGDIKNYQVRRGDLLVAEGGDVGQTGFVTDVPTDTIIQNSLHRVRPISGDVRYLKHVLDAVRCSGWLDVICNRSSFGHLTVEKLSKLTIPWPSRCTQRVIADFLDSETARLDALGLQKVALRSRLRERQQGTASQALDALGTQFGRVPLRRFVARIEQGWSPVCDSVPAEPTQWGVLKTSAVSTGRFQPDENKRLPQNTELDRRWVVNDGDLLVTRGSGSADSVGRAAVARVGECHLLLSDLIYPSTA
ncbi:MAG: restriction endonuclease subunit S [Microlunatus sp.]|nr:restriction endonuclease subunit S [Microlunatus sp.]MDN5794039.1 restriction endonuclease subunit S [Brevibacterium aurantiacum]